MAKINYDKAGLDLSGTMPYHMGLPQDKFLKIGDSYRGTVAGMYDKERTSAEAQRDQAPVEIAKQLTQNAVIDPNQDISGQFRGVQSEAYGAARGAREALGTRANALRSILSLPEYNPTGEDNSSNTVRTIESAVNDQAQVSHPNAIAMQRAKLLRQGGV